MNRKAFSLIELVMVIMFLGILTVVAVMAVDKIFQKGTKEASAATKKILVPLIDDYLLEKDNAGCTDDSCPLNVLVTEGYLKDKPCDKTSNKVIDTANTKFKISLDENNRYYCVTCENLTTWEIKLTAEKCSDINLTPTP